jgi:hypothetical protein
MPSPAGLFDEESRLKAIAAKACAENVDGLLDSLSGVLEPGQEPMVRQKLEMMPVSFRLVYVEAMLGNSLASSVKAFCSECCGYDRESTGSCVCKGCPHWPYRPYQK